MATEMVLLECAECGRQNYSTFRNKKKMANKVEKKKYCRWDKKHTVHKEAK
jgi:large subunit ribosomal protein L33